MAKGAIRLFSYIHLLYHHICQLLYFPYLQPSGSDTAAAPLDVRTINCHHHTSRITEIIRDNNKVASIDLHNVSIGQILKVAAAVHMHACLTVRTREQADVAKAAHENLITITDCLERIRQGCRIFDRVVCCKAPFGIPVTEISLRILVITVEHIIRHVQLAQRFC